MPSTSLIDLFVPTDNAHEASVAVAMAGLDAGVLVFDSLEDLSTFVSEGPTPMHGALGVAVEGGTAMVLLPTCDHEGYADLAALHTIEDVAAMARRAGGCAVLAGGRMGVDGCAQDVTGAAASQPSQLVQMVWRSILARDLSFEDASLNGRRVLAGSGPMAELAGVGRFATLLPVDGADRLAIISALNQGLGIPVERQQRANAEPHPAKKKRRRRRRRRSDKPHDSSAETESSTQGDAPPNPEPEG